MGKKRSKKLSTVSSHSNTSDVSILTDSSFHQDISTSKNCEVFKVLLSHNTENTDEYYKWTKNCYWKNIAFVAPSVLQEYGCNPVILIQGKSKCAMFMAVPLKSVKNRNIVLLNGMGFNNEELVTFCHLRKVYEAKEVYITIESSPPLNCFQEMLVKKLSNTFIWCGMKLELSLFDVKTECVVSKVVPNEELSKSNCSVNITDSLNHAASFFSSLTLQDSINYTSENVETQPVACFIINHCSKIIVSGPSEKETELSFPLFKDIGGYHQQINIIRNYIDTFLKNTKDKGCHSILLLSGPSKTGKNMILDAISNEYDVPTMKLNMTLLNCMDSSTAMEKEIKLIVNNVSKKSPRFLLLHRFEVFYSLKTKDRISNLFRLLNEICDDQIFIIATLSSELAFDHQLLHSSFSVREVKFTLPSISDREEIIEKILIKQNQELPPIQVKQFAELSHGLSGGDVNRILKVDVPLLSLIRMKNTSQITSSSPHINFSDIETAIKKRKTYLLSSDLKTKKVKWTDIGGMETIKKELIEELELLTQTSKEKLERFNYTPSQGLLLYGPPGCSKTMIAKALATECNWNFISKKASDIMNMYVGESEKAVAKLFLEARARAPCIIFLDEIDAIAPARDSSSAASGVQNRVVNCLLNEMSGIEALKDVFVIAATNRPDIVDDALLRSGRIGKHIYVPLPDSKTREEVFKLCMKNRKVSDDVVYEDLIEKTEGYTGAEIVQLCNEAALQLLIADCPSPVIKKEHFERALLTVLPLTNKDTIYFYEQFASKYCK